MIVRPHCAAPTKAGCNIRQYIPACLIYSICQGKGNYVYCKVCSLYCSGHNTKRLIEYVVLLIYEDGLCMIAVLYLNITVDIKMRCASNMTIISTFADLMLHTLYIKRCCYHV